MSHGEDFGLGTGRLLVPGYAYGLRTWSLKRSDPQVLTGRYGKDWTSGINEASCEKHTGEVPERKCSCGYYGYWSTHKTRIIEEAEQSPCVCSACIKVYTVAGVIRISGHVIVGTAGFRAQKAEIVALSLPMFLKDLDVRIDTFSRFIGIQPEVLRTIWGLAKAENEAGCLDLDDARSWLLDKFHAPVFGSIEEMLREYPADPPESR